MNRSRLRFIHLDFVCEKGTPKIARPRDGVTSTLANPSYAYDGSGPYTESLKVTSALDSAGSTVRHPRKLH